MSIDRFRVIFSSRAPAAEAFNAADETMRGWHRGQPHGQAGLSRTAAVSPDGGQAEQWRLGEGSRAVTLSVYAPASAASTWFWLEASSDEVLHLVRVLLDSVAA